MYVLSWLWRVLTAKPFSRYISTTIELGSLDVAFLLADLFCSMVGAK